jgi:DNA-directed RNA polymerase subunit L
MTDLDISVRLNNYRPHDDIRRGRLELLCSGKDMNDQFMNGLGRIAMKRVPTYAFAYDLIKIEKINQESGYHDSVPFNHDYMRDRMKNTPPMNVDPMIAFLHERHWKNVDYLSPDREVHEAEKRVEAQIDAKNATDDIVNITTNDMKVYIDNELTSIYSQQAPLLLISLKPKEAFKCNMRAVLGIGLNDTCWDACSNFWYDQETVPDKTIVCFESASRFDEFILVDRALEYFRIKTKLLKDEINRMFLLEKNPLDRFQITINDEDHTMGEAINYEFQSHPDILKSSCAKPDHLVRQIVIDVVAFKKEKLLDSIMESMDGLTKKIDKFEKEFKKIERKESPFYNSFKTKQTASKSSNTGSAPTNSPTNSPTNGSAPTDELKSNDKGKSKDKKKVKKTK